MDSESVFTLRLLQRTEQLQAALAAGDKAAEAEAREILRRVRPGASISRADVSGWRNFPPSEGTIYRPVCTS
jgi:hypothetical protein